jgi:AcrR family transcriptional regulator
MSTELETKHRIFDTAAKSFLKYGISKVTMEELADEMGMSKKTIYKFFPSKENLLRELLHEMKNETVCHCNVILHQTNIDFVEKLKQLLTYIGERYSKWSPHFISDIRKNSPEVWKEVEQFRTTQIFEDFTRLINEGVEQGVFRKDINQHIIVMLYAGATQHLVNPETLSQHSFSAAEAFENIIRIIFEGIFTNKGRETYAAQTM